MSEVGKMGAEDFAKGLHDVRRFVWSMRAELLQVEKAVNEGRLEDAEDLMDRLQEGNSVAEPPTKGRLRRLSLVFSWIFILGYMPIMGYNTVLNVIKEPTLINVVSTVCGILLVAVISWAPLLTTMFREYKERN